MAGFTIRAKKDLVSAQECRCSRTLLALNCRGKPAAVPGLRHLSSAPESRALPRGFGVGAADQGASLGNSLALHTGEGHVAARGLSCSGLI